MTDMFKEVRAWMNAVEQETPEKPGLVDRDTKNLRKRLVWEEVSELERGMNENDLVAIADGCADAIVVIAGTAVAYGIPLNEVFAEVMRSNWTKVTEEGVLRDNYGKVIKPPGYQKPDLEPIIARSVEEGSVDTPLLT